MTRVFVERVFGIGFVWHVNCPRPGPGFGVVYGEVVAQLIGGDASEAFGEFCRIAEECAAGSDFIIEVRRFDYECVAFPMTAGVAHIAADAAADMWTPIQRNDAIFMDHFIADHDIPGSLNDVVPEIVQSGKHARDWSTRDASAVVVKVLPRIHFVRKVLAGSEAAALA